LDHQAQQGISLLHFSVLKQNSDLLSWLLEHGANPDVQTDEHMTPLCVATKDYFATQKLLASGAASSVQCGLEGQTALIRSVSDNCNIAELLVENGANPDLVDFYGRSALFYARKMKKLKCI
jgi:ankyrin repeat protein